LVRLDHIKSSFLLSFRISAARIRKILENVGLAHESLPYNVVASAQVLANVANLLNIRDTELSRCVSISPFLFVCLISAIIKFEFLELLLF
jgi:hypothetical protein